MDISPLYELRARLRAAMIAGTGLLSEDFRLRRAVEAFAPLEQASPVFAKIGQLSQTLLSPKAENNEDSLLEDNLLDAITLADAVLCTQGKVPVDGNVEPVTGSPGGIAVTNAPYSVVKALTESLCTSGSGHYSYVMNTYREQPGLFKDYRVKTAMIQALGASYTELADTVEQWLKQEDASILPLLQKDFDPKGKKETVRRIHVMSAIDVKASNEFFVKILPEAEKEARQSLIFSLRRCPENVDLLLELTKTEKGNAKKTAYYALAYMEDEKAEAAFTKLYQKKPAEAMQYLVYADTKWASRFVAEKLKEQLSPWTETDSISADPVPAISQEQAGLLVQTLTALPGKSGAGICEAFRMAADITLSSDIRVREIALRLQPLIPTLLQRALYCHPDPGLCDLAIEICEAGHLTYFPAAVTAQLLGREDCSKWLDEQRQGKFSHHNEDFYPLLARGITGLRFSEEENAHVLSLEYVSRVHPSGEPMPKYSQPVKQDITGRFTDILMECQDRGFDRILMDCINDRDEAYCRKLGDYFYSRALELEATRDYMLALKRCHYPKCQGLAVNLLSRRGLSVFYLSELSEYAAILPGDRTAIYEELQRIFDLYKQGRLKMAGSRQGEEYFLEYLEQWKNG